MIYTVVGLCRVSVSVWRNWLEMADEALFQFLHSEIIQYVNSAETGESVRALKTLTLNSVIEPNKPSTLIKQTVRMLHVELM